MKKIGIAAALVLVLCALAGCALRLPSAAPAAPTAYESRTEAPAEVPEPTAEATEVSEPAAEATEEPAETAEPLPAATPEPELLQLTAEPVRFAAPVAMDPETISVWLAAVPAYDGTPSIELVSDGSEAGFETPETGSILFSELDELGRCGPAVGCIGMETVSDEKRGPIGMVKPSGWHTVRYDFIDQKYLFNRCHLIGFALSGVNADERNLITGTRSMNTQGMLPYEQEILSYVYRTRNHVAYRVTPCFMADDLVARGVRMEARSVEDGGASLSIDVYCYNAEPYVAIDYATGDNWQDNSVGAADDASEEETFRALDDAELADETVRSLPEETEEEEEKHYVLNRNSLKFHFPDCDSVKEMSSKNRIDYTGSRETLIEVGYTPCKSCCP